MKVFVISKSYDWGEEYGSGKEIVKVVSSADVAKKYCEIEHLIAGGQYGYEFNWEEVEFEE